MLYFTDQEIDQLMTEDVPYFDLTTSLLRLENKPSKIQVTTREPTVVCCTEEVMKIFNKSGVQTTLFTPSGEHLEKDVKFLEGEGLSGSLFTIARTIENLLRYASGIATRTRMLLEKAHEANPDIMVATTRKVIPYTRKIAIKAVNSGGATIHRFGLSESILIYKNHYHFLGGIENLEKRLKEQRARAGGKMITVEVETPADALRVVKTGVDVVQLDKFSPADIRKIRKAILKSGSGTKLAAAGNITIKNVSDYAGSGADILVTSWPYYGEPADMTISIQPIFDLY
ncbi:MAG: ModD protein [Bacteroidales bacterium]|nr:ModD protein [Bacteroidales bacterium]